jgi:hypothetical protein
MMAFVLLLIMALGAHRVCAEGGERAASADVVRCSVSCADVLLARCGYGDLSYIAL